MIVWIVAFFMSVLVMGLVGSCRYSISHKLMKMFIEIPAEQIRAYEALWIIAECFIVLSDETIWRHNTVLVFCGIAVLLFTQWILMRIAGKATSCIKRYICKRRLSSLMVSRRIRARMRCAHEFE